jgi:hypothetical protein
MVDFKKRLKTIIYKTHSLEQTAEAHRYVENGPAQGKAPINVV